MSPFQRLIPLLAILAIVGAAQFASAGGVLDRIAYGVDGAESSHGRDPRMWRTEPDGPQGPMQVSAAAANDAGVGDRFDETQNRALGRAYLATCTGATAAGPTQSPLIIGGPGPWSNWT